VFVERERERERERREREVKDEKTIADTRSVPDSRAGEKHGLGIARRDLNEPRGYTRAPRRLQCVRGRGGDRAW